MNDIQQQAYDEYKSMVENDARERESIRRENMDAEFYGAQARAFNSISKAFGQEPIFREEPEDDDMETPEEREERLEARRDALREAQTEAEYERNLDHANDNKI